MSQPRVVIPCGPDLAGAIDLLVAHGFELQSISPADDPTTAVVRHAGLELVLDSGRPVTAPVVVELPDAEADLSLPWIELRAYDPEPPLAVPSGRQATWISRGDAGSWTVGRAGMRYRDLLPERHGGRFVASHILVPDGGPVPDYVHHHRVRFQLIYCRSGWVEVVYEDQGEPFVLRPGDCVLQPPGIRHRVLRASDGLEVVEITCPAVHETFVDHVMALPNGVGDPAREFGGQRFVRHVAATTPWQPAGRPGQERRDTGIASATGGLASVEVLRVSAGDAPELDLTHDGELRFVLVLTGAARLTGHGPAGGAVVLAPPDSVTVAAGDRVRLVGMAPGTELLDVARPART